MYFALKQNNIPMKTLLTLLLLSSLILNSSAQKSKIKVIPQDGQEFTGKKIIKGLVKSGVKILAVKTNFSTTSHVLGFFTDPTRYMGIGQGLILSTGIVDNLTSASSGENFTSIEIEDTTMIQQIVQDILDNSQPETQLQTINSLDLHKFAKPGDQDLSNEINGLKTFDARIIEIKFIPSADTLYYRYVFASEEYDEFVCSEFNDVFAFYLSREGKKKKNIALVPGQKLPVSINTINNGNPLNSACQKTNAHLYQKNNGNQNLLFDGFTKVLDIRQKVIPGKVYNLKIAIADASDSVWDSAVMIENGSIFSYFNSFELSFELNSSVIENQKILEKILKALKKHPKSKIQLIGHSDLSGSAKYNFELSKKRVENLSTFLVNNKIDSSRIIETYKGETMPRYKNASKNRRIEIFILGN
jgi:outer membrane protein OmpA-like peptidoglycan-associated protein